MKLKNVAPVNFLGMQLTLRTVAGVVQEKATRSSSHIESHHNAHGHLSRVAMVTEQHQDIWLNADDGEEVRLGVGGLAVPMRTGHRLQAFFAARGAERGTLVAVKNLNTGQVHETFNDHQRLPGVGFLKLPLLQTLGAGPLSFLFGAGTFIGGGLLALTGLPFTVGLAFAGTAIGALLIRQHSQAIQGFVKFRNELARAIEAGSEKLGSQ